MAGLETDIYIIKDTYGVMTTTGHQEESVWVPHLAPRGGAWWESVWVLPALQVWVLSNILHMASSVKIIQFQILIMKEAKIIEQ